MAMFTKLSIITATNAFTHSVAGRVTDLELKSGDTLILTWLQPDPPHGVILHYNIRITDQQTGNTTLVSEYKQTSISKSLLTQDLDITNGVFLLVQVYSH